MQFRDIILSASVLRAKGNYNEAIKLLEANLQKIMDEDPDFLLNAYIVLTYSAIDNNDKQAAIKYAKEAENIEPELPTVKKLLSNIWFRRFNWLGHNKRVSGRLRGGFGLNRSDSGFSGLYGLNHSDSAAHAQHYAFLYNERVLLNRVFFLMFNLSNKEK